MINIDISLFIQMANFVLMIFILNIILYKPIRNIVNQRKEKVEGLEKNIEMSNRDAVEKDEAYKSGIKDARVKGLKEKETLMQAAADEEKEIIDKKKLTKNPFLFLFLFVIALAYFLAYVPSRTLPLLEFGEIATSDIIAPAEITIIDTETTENRRKQPTNTYVGKR